MINPRDNPVMYLWLLSCLLQNRRHAKDSKGRAPDVEKTYEEMYYMVDRAVSEFTKAENSDWYNRLGDLIAEWADFCVFSGKAI